MNLSRARFIEITVALSLTGAAAAYAAIAHATSREPKPQMRSTSGKAAPTEAAIPARFVAP